MNPSREKIAECIATAGGLGRTRPALAGVLVSAAAALIAPCLPLLPRLALIAALCAAGFWAVETLKKNAPEKIGEGIVVDQAVGQILATIGHIASWSAPAQSTYLVPAFMIYRFIAILQPWPLYACANRKNGAGIMLRGILGGLIASAILMGFRKYFVEV